MYEYFDEQLNRVNQYIGYVENFIHTTQVTVPDLNQMMRDVAGNGFSDERKRLAVKMKSISAEVDAVVTQCRRITKQIRSYKNSLFVEEQKLLPVIEKLQQEVDEAPLKMIGGIAKSLLFGSLDGALGALDVIMAGVEGVMGGASGMSAASRLQRLKGLRAQFYDAGNTIERLRQSVTNRIEAYQQLLSANIRHLFKAAKHRIGEKYGVQWWHSDGLLWFLHDYKMVLAITCIVISLLSTVVIFEVFRRNRTTVMPESIQNAEGCISGAQPEINIDVFKRYVVAGDLYSIGKAVRKDPGILTVTDGNRQTPLHWAARKGSAKTVKLLLAKGARVDARDKYGNTPATIAIKYYHTEVVKLLGKAGGTSHSKK